MPKEKIENLVKRILLGVMRFVLFFFDEKEYNDKYNDIRKDFEKGKLENVLVSSLIVILLVTVILAIVFFCWNIVTGLIFLLIAKLFVNDILFTIIVGAGLGALIVIGGRDEFRGVNRRFLVSLIYFSVWAWLINYGYGIWISSFGLAPLTFSLYYTLSLAITILIGVFLSSFR